MKEVLRQLLDAEESGRQAAQAMEAEATEVLRIARARGAAIAEETRERANRDIAELEQRVQREIEEHRAAIGQHADLRIDQSERAAEQHWAEAVESAVALLLGE